MKIFLFILYNIYVAHGIRVIRPERKLTGKLDGIRRNYDNSHIFNLYFNLFSVVFPPSARKCASRSSVDGWDNCCPGRVDSCYGCDPDLLLQGQVKN